jgi:hypothetical protein
MPAEGEAVVLRLMWLAGCTLAALLTGVMSADGAWVPGFAAVMAAQAAVLAGNASRLPSWATWPAALVCAAVGALGHHGTDLVVYVVLVSGLLLVAGRFARMSADLSAFCRTEEDAAARRTFRTTTLADPVAREFARARRDQSRLVVASIAVPEARGAARRLARIARELVPSLRRTDAIVHAITDRLVVVLPGGDDDVAAAVLERALVGERKGVLVGTATFPEDGPTWESLKDVARSRERPWPWTGSAGVGLRTARFTSNGARQDASVQRAEGARS